ncbi:gypsy retrotransposon integrase-like protein 1 isoform X2 [Heterocephalus glaber]|uniref:Gypsy retrotransposon integrase-like protein 1 n=1 Tax=Heterocephalus glaber TaxID=10181 RepID=A0AAX6SSP5_HETGA|nr:gypsy retrotransposon integrase-like protein 1 isoform X2 [Heterocephalus glaber]
MVRSGKNGDLHLKQIAYYKRTGEYHATTLPSERSGIRRAAKKFVFKEKQLFYVGKDRKQNRLVIVSEEEKNKVLRECHENDAGAHHGISRTLTLVESNYYWTSVTNDVKQWVYACQHCQVAKNTVILAPKQHLLKVENSWSIVTVDPMGPFHASNRSHVYAIILTDLFTKWVMILPLCDVSASEISKAITNVFFLYGPPQKIIMDQRDEFIQQINVELYGLFGTKEIVISHAAGTVNPTESTPRTIKAFLSKHCADHPENWDEHLSAVSFAFNATHLTSDTLHEMDADNTSMFARILDAFKEAEKIMEAKTTSMGQVENHLNGLHKNKIIVKKKPKQLNPFHLKVGHEVLRQRKNRWKDGRFQSEWIGPCVIDYITESGCAVLRDNTGTRLKRPIKMSHLKPYVRESSEQDSLYLLQGSIVADHDYIGLPEIPVGTHQANILVEDATVGVVDNELLTSSKEHELLEYRNPKTSSLIEDHGTLEKQTFSLLDSSNQVLEYLKRGSLDTDSGRISYEDERDPSTSHEITKIASKLPGAGVEEQSRFSHRAVRRINTSSQTSAFRTVSLLECSGLVPGTRPV